MADLNTEQVVDYLSNLPVIQLAGLIKTLEDKWGVKAAPRLREESSCDFRGFAVVLCPLVFRRLPDGVGDSIELSRPQEPRPCWADYRGSQPYRHPEELVRQVLADERAAEHPPGGWPP